MRAMNVFFSDEKHIFSCNSAPRLVFSPLRLLCCFCDNQEETEQGFSWEGMR